MSLIDALDKIIEDETLSKNERDAAKKAKSYLRRRSELTLRVDKASDILCAVAESLNCSTYSMLEEGSTVNVIHGPKKNVEVAGKILDIAASFDLLSYVLVANKCRRVLDKEKDDNSYQYSRGSNKIVRVKNKKSSKSRLSNEEAEAIASKIMTGIVD